MARIFGLDLAAIVNTSIKAAGNLAPMTLVKRVSRQPTTGDIAAGTRVTEQSIACRGYAETTTGPGARGLVVQLLGASIVHEGARVEPASDDAVIIDGVRYAIEKVGGATDGAVYECTCAAPGGGVRR